MTKKSHTQYQAMRKNASEFKSREEYLNHELSIMSFKRWGIHIPFKHYNIELEDWVPAIAATIGEAVAMCKRQYPDDPIIDQVVLRNRGMDLVLSGSIKREE